MAQFVPVVAVVTVPVPPKADPAEYQPLILRIRVHRIAWESGTAGGSNGEYRLQRYCLRRMAQAAFDEYENIRGTRGMARRTRSTVVYLHPPVVPVLPGPPILHEAANAIPAQPREICLSPAPRDLSGDVR